MPYNSIDILQKTLAKNMFSYAKSPKKAAGRALGTLVEIINFYLLKSWGYEDCISIERSVPEYGNAAITHNVEFALHPKKNVGNICFKEDDLPFTAKKIAKQIKGMDIDFSKVKNSQLLSKSKLLRNSCIIHEKKDYFIIAYLRKKRGKVWNVAIRRLHTDPYAVFECKRVGVEEGISKGPQTIEKAKQGAYVSKTISSLQRIRMIDGSFYGIMQLPGGKLKYEPYNQFLRHIINSDDLDLLRCFILTVGVVSNHGNWFTSKNHNKELKILAQSYNWLLFLTDEGLCDFIENLLLNPKKRYESAKKAFMKSYRGDKSGNSFTKVKILLSADHVIQEYFKENISKIESWFNVIAPIDENIKGLKSDLTKLSKNIRWRTLQ